MRPKGTERFFHLLTRTQLFSHFIEARSLSSDNDAVFSFFDECTEKVILSYYGLINATVNKCSVQRRIKVKRAESGVCAAR